jgi:hypothetical protein
MPSLKITGATLTDIENGLIITYGNLRIKQLYSVENAIKWKVTLYEYHLFDMAIAHCTASKSDDGATITMNVAIPPAWWIIVGLGYLACIIPGIFITIIYLLCYYALHLKVKNNFQNIVTAVHNIMINQANSSPKNTSAEIMGN